MTAAPKTITDAVDAREDFRCARCAAWIQSGGSRHHRQRRQVGHHSIPNIILMCGSGTTGCHGWAHANPVKAMAFGYIVPTWIQDAADVPLLISVIDPIQGAIYLWVMLLAAGGRKTISTRAAQRTMRGLGITTTTEGLFD